MKILITGASGFVGRELVKQLQKKHTIIKYNTSDGNNILDLKNLNQKMKGINIVIHLASKINENKKEIFQTNVDGTKNVINSAIQNNVKKIIFLSSTGVYGENKNIIDEKTIPKPKTNYEISKLKAEEIILQNKNKIHTNIIRSAMIFGNNSYWKNMFNILKKNFPLPCNGKNNFQIIYVKDLVYAIELVMKNGEKNEIYLVSGDEKWTLEQFCKYSKNIISNNNTILKIPKKIALLIGKIFKIKIINENNIYHLCKERNYSLKKIKSLGFKQKYSLKKSIQKTIKEMKI